MSIHFRHLQLHIQKVTTERKSIRREKKERKKDKKQIASLGWMEILVFIDLVEYILIAIVNVKTLSKSINVNGIFGASGKKLKPQGPHFYLNNATCPTLANYFSATSTANDVLNNIS